MTGVHRRLVRVTRHKRASVLVLLGAVYILTGWVQQDTADILQRAPLLGQNYAAHVDVMPLEAWGWTFMFAGAVGIACAVAGRMEQWIGFGVLQALSLFWGSLFLASWAETGYNRAGLGALTWALVSGVLFIVADWDDPPPAGGGRS